MVRKHLLILKLLTLTFVYEMFLLGTSVNNVVSATNYLYSGKPFETEVIQLTSETVFSDLLKPIVGEPTMLIQDRLSINLKVVPLGVEEDGNLANPKNWNEAGWYKGGAKVSENGNMVINAHYDRPGGNPAGFWMLKNTKVGDRFKIVDEYDRMYEYSVVEYSLIDIKDPNRLEILKNLDNGKSMLTMITCGGVWLPGQSTYNKRLVVKAELVQ